MTATSSLYVGSVVHRRLLPKRASACATPRSGFCSTSTTLPILRERRLKLFSRGRFKCGELL